MAKKPETKLNFEESLEKLEALVGQMEEDTLPLEDLLANYEKGHKLLSQCQNLLDGARKRIEVVQLTRGNGSEETENKLATEPSTGDTPTSEAPSDDIRLL